MKHVTASETQTKTNSERANCVGFMLLGNDADPGVDIADHMLSNTFFSRTTHASHMG